MRQVKVFQPQELEQYIKFRKYVLNIIDLGQGKRLNDILRSLTVLMEKSRQGSV